MFAAGNKAKHLSSVNHTTNTIHHHQKDLFYSTLLSDISTVSPDDYLLLYGNFNGHVGKAPEGFNRVHGEQRFGSGNADGMIILDLCAAANFAIKNT